MDEDEVRFMGADGGALVTIPQEEGELPPTEQDDANVTVLTADVQPNDNGEYMCPECLADPEVIEIKSFSARGPLGKHRKEAHGVHGASRTAKGGAGKHHRKRNPKADAPFDSKKALSLIFPDGGVPLDPEVMRNTLDWIEEGVILHRNTAKYRK